MKQSCENCRFWRGADPSMKRIGNIKLCTYLMPQSADFYAPPEHAPFWASSITFRTTSYDGQSCAVHQSKRKARK